MVKKSLVALVFLTLFFYSGHVVIQTIKCNCDGWFVQWWIIGVTIFIIDHIIRTLHK